MPRKTMVPGNCLSCGFGGIYIRMSYFDKYITVHFSHFGESISGWSDLSPKQKLFMSLKILTDSFGVLILIVIISEVIN